MRICGWKWLFCYEKSLSLTIIEGFQCNLKSWRDKIVCRATIIITKYQTVTTHPRINESIISHFWPHRFAWIPDDLIEFKNYQQRLGGNVVSLKWIIFSLNIILQNSGNFHKVWVVILRLFKYRPTDSHVEPEVNHYHQRDQASRRSRILIPGRGIYKKIILLLEIHIRLVFLHGGVFQFSWRSIF